MDGMNRIRREVGVAGFGEVQYSSMGRILDLLNWGLGMARDSAGLDVGEKIFNRG